VTGPASNSCVHKQAVVTPSLKKVSLQITAIIIVIRNQNFSSSSSGEYLIVSDFPAERYHLPPPVEEIMVI
jgi:hypothetical protein